jgi:site-specific DNA-methyltransferase (adenine-specific)
MSEIHLLQGDCIDILPTLPDMCADAILTDIPYGTTACKWDVVIPFAPMWEQVKRLCKGAFVTTASQPFTTLLIASNLEWFKYEWIWEKAIGANPLLCKKRPMKYHENIVVFSQNGHTYNPIMTKGKMREKKPVMSGNKIDENWGGMMRGVKGTSNINDVYYPRSVFYISNADQAAKDHPTQKPVALYEYLIKTYTNPGDTVLDFCMGSGTTGVAAVKTGRNFIGIEKEAPYFQTSERRITDAQMQQVMPL